MKIVHKNLNQKMVIAQSIDYLCLFKKYLSFDKATR